MKCYRRILGIWWWQKIRNDTIRKDINRTSTIIDKIKQRKLQMFGHICRMPNNRLIKTTLFEKVEGKRKRGRPRRRWLDDVKDWCTPLTIDEARQLAEDRDEWKEFIQQM